MERLNALSDLFRYELRDLYNSEKQFAEALPLMIENTQDKELKEIFIDQQEEARMQLDRLKGVAGRMKMDLSGEHSEAMDGITNELKNIIDTAEGKSPVLDAALIKSDQKGRHYHICSYGACVAYAQQMGFTEEASLLNDNLRQEKAGDRKLSAIAFRKINPAARAGHRSFS